MGQINAPIMAHAESGNCGVIRHAGPADAVALYARYRAGDRCAMIIARSTRSRIAITVSCVMIKCGVVVRTDIRMVVLHAIIDNADDDARSGIIVPDIGNINVDARRSATCAGIEQMPLLTELRVVWV